MQFKGIYVPIVTPFGPEGKINFKVLEELIERLIGEGVAGLVPCGSTGEFYALSEEEKLSVMKKVVEVAAGRVTLLAGTNAPSTGEVLKNSQIAADLGYQGLLLAPPYYGLPSPRELINHFNVIADKIGLPIMLYNFPARAGVEIDYEVMDGIADNPNIVAIKESSGSMARVFGLIQRYQGRVQLCCGSDDQALDYFMWGSVAWVGGAASFSAPRHVELIEACIKGDFATGRKLMDKMLPLMCHLEEGRFNCKVKYCCQLAGIEAGDPRLPLLPLNNEEKAYIKPLYELAVS